jgi:hypothetical protein
MSARKPKKNQKKEGGLNITGGVRVKNGDFVGGDKNTNVGNGSTYVGGNVANSNLVTGDNNVVSITNTAREELFEEILKKIEVRPATSPAEKDDLKADVKEIKAEAEKGEAADETFLGRRLRNIARMAPDIFEVITATLVNPAAGFATVVKKIAERAKAPASDGEANA